MASSAAQTISGSAHTQALQGRMHHKAAREQTPANDRFSDMLADADNTQPNAQQNKTDAPRAETRKTQKADTADKTDDTGKTATPDEPKTKAARGETGKADKPVVEKADDAASSDKPAAASDTIKTDIAIDMPAPVAVGAQPAPQAPDATAEDAVQDDAAQAITAATLGNPAKATQDKPAPDQAQPQTQDAGAAETPAQDFKAALHQAKDDTAGAKPADAEKVKTAEASADAKTADARPVDLKPAPDAPALPQTAQAHMARGADRIAPTAPMETTPRPQAAPDVNQFAVEVAAKSQSGAKQFDIRLDPPELGRVEVRLSIDAAGKAEAHLTADQPKTLDLLQKDASILARALRDAGLNVNPDGLNFSLKNQQDHAGGGARQQHSGARNVFAAAGGNSIETASMDASAYTRRALGLLDIRV